MVGSGSSRRLKLGQTTSSNVREHGPLGRGALRVIEWVRLFNTAMHYAAGVALVGMLVLTIADITGRTVFNDPVPGTVEVTALVLVAVVFLGLAHSEDLGDHITVDLLYVRLGDRFKVVLDVFADLVSVVVIGLMSLQLYRFTLRQAETGAESPVLQWPVWPFVLVAALGALGYAVSILFKLILRFMGEPTEAIDSMTGKSGGLESGGIEI